MFVDIRKRSRTVAAATILEQIYSDYIIREERYGSAQMMRLSSR